MVNRTLVTSGPFNVSDYVAGEFTELTYNPDYFYGLGDAYGPSEPIPTLPYPSILPLIAGAIGAAVVILVGGYVLMR